MDEKLHRAQNNAKQVGNCNSAVTRAAQDACASQHANTRSTRAIDATKGKNERFFANRMCSRRVGSKTRHRKPLRSSPNALAIVGPKEKTASTIATVAARSPKEFAAEALGRVARIDTAITPNTMGITSA